MLLKYARALADIQHLDEAADYAERGYARAKQGGNDVARGQSLFVRANVYRTKGDLDAAARMLDEVEPWLRRSLPDGHIAFATLADQRALLAQARGDAAGALVLENRAIDIAEASGRNKREGSDNLRVYLVHRSEDRTAARTRGRGRRRRVARVGDRGDGRAAGELFEHQGLRVSGARPRRGRARPSRRGEGRVHVGGQAVEHALGADHTETQRARQLAQGE